jgi:hypothetical protein
VVDASCNAVLNLWRFKSEVRTQNVTVKIVVTDVLRGVQRGRRAVPEIDL